MTAILPGLPGGQEPPRRGFKSKTPNVEGIAAGELPGGGARFGWGSVTRHQISGWRFQHRRLANGVALQDTRMLADPLSRVGRGMSVGALISVVLIFGAFVVSVFKPTGLTGGHAVLTDRASGALYVNVNDQLHPVLNLASARLIVGKPDSPAAVTARELDRYPLGNMLGIPQAPTRIVPSSDRDARWMVCDAVSGPDVGSTVIVGDPVAAPGHATGLAEDSALLASADGEATWLIWGGKRAKIDLHTTAVAAAVGITLDTPAPRAINRALLNLIPESNPLAVPVVPGGGEPPRFGWPAPGPAPLVGSVVTDHEGDALRYWLVAADGLQPISPVVASILRSSDSHGLVEPPELTPDQVAKIAQVRVIDTDAFPASVLRILDPVTDPVTCGQWVKLDGAPTSRLSLLAGQSLPVAVDAPPVALAEAGPTTASRVVMPRGSGYFVQVTGQQPQSATKEQLFWVSDLGVRCGLEDTEGQPGSAAAALGMTAAPLPIPWAVLSLLQPGPALSKADALVAH